MCPPRPARIMTRVSAVSARGTVEMLNASKRAKVSTDVPSQAPNPPSLLTTSLITGAGLGRRMRRSCAEACLMVIRLTYSPCICPATEWDAQHGRGSFKSF
jgi:hypothetical protein